MEDQHELQRLKAEENDPSVEDGNLSVEFERDKLRGKWSGNFEVVLSLVGYTVGLGNILRFPYLCLRNGGGAFLIPFFLFLILCGGPLYYLEVCMGQFSGKSPIVIWEICPLFKGIGAIMVFLSAIYIWYASVIFAWAIYYLVCSFNPTLGWTTCNNWWNTPQCVEIIGSVNSMSNTSMTVNIAGNFSTENGTTSVNDVNSTILTGGHRTAATEFWLYNVLRISDGIDNLGGLQIHLVGALFVGWLITFLCLAKGIKTVGKVVYVTVTLPYILLTVLLIRGVTLDGAVDGLKLYLTPDFERLKHGQVWMEAAIQVFYSLGPAWGGVITMSSFNKFNHNSLRDTVVVCFFDSFTAFYGGLSVFSVLGFLAKETGLPITDLATSGYGLAFIVYPEALSRMPLPQLWSALFFVTLLLIGIDTQLASFETVSNAVIDAFFDKLHKYKLYISLSISIGMFLIGLPLATSGGYYIFQLADWYTAAFSVFFTSFLEVFIIAWIYGADRFSQDVAAMTGSYPSIFIRIAWAIILPILIFAMFSMALLNYQSPSYGEGGYVFPDYALVIGNLIAVLPIILLVGGALLMFMKQEGSPLQRISTLLRSGSNWLPNDKNQRLIYMEKPYVYEQSLGRRILRNVFGIMKDLPHAIDKHVVEA